MKTRFIRKTFITSRTEVVEQEVEAKESFAEEALQWKNVQATPTIKYSDDVIYEPFDFSSMDGFTVGRVDDYEDVINLWNSYLEPVAMTISTTLTKYLRIIFDFFVYAIAVTISASNTDIKNSNGRVKNKKQTIAGGTLLILGTLTIFLRVLSNDLPKRQDILSPLITQETKNSCNNTYNIYKSNNINIINK